MQLPNKQFDNLYSNVEIREINGVKREYLLPDIGQMQMYVNYYDREIKQDDENPTVGILLSTNKNETVVKYTLP